MGKLKPFSNVQMNAVPNWIFERLKKLSYDKRIPVSQLIGIALDNELDAPEPFNYPTELPEGTDSGGYYKEANLILEYLLRYDNKGMDVATLLMCRHDIGIKERADVLRGIRELEKVDPPIIEKFYPSRPQFSYDRDYRRIRVVRSKI